MNTKKFGVQHLREAFSTYDNDFGSSVLRQCSAELFVLSQALGNGLADSVAQTVLCGIAQRMAVAADIEDNLVEGTEAL